MIYTHCQLAVGVKGTWCICNTLFFYLTSTSGLLCKVSAGNENACLTTKHLTVLGKAEPKLVPLVIAFRYWAKVGLHFLNACIHLCILHVYMQCDVIFLLRLCHLKTFRCLFVNIRSICIRILEQKLKENSVFVSYYNSIAQKIKMICNAY